MTAMVTNPLNVACPCCARQPGQPCDWDSTAYHYQRIDAATMLDTIGSDTQPPTTAAFDAAILATGDV